METFRIDNKFSRASILTLEDLMDALFKVDRFQNVFEEYLLLVLRS